MLCEARFAAALQRPSGLTEIVLSRVASPKGLTQPAPQQFASSLLSTPMILGLERCEFPPRRNTLWRFTRCFVEGGSGFAEAAVSDSPGSCSQRSPSPGNGMALPRPSPGARCACSDPHADRELRSARAQLQDAFKATPASTAGGAYCLTAGASSRSLSRQTVALLRSLTRVTRTSERRRVVRLYQPARGEYTPTDARLVVEHRGRRLPRQAVTLAHAILIDPH
jgi:hypothetical protein